MTPHYHQQAGMGVSPGKKVATMRHRTADQHGFTLLETMVYIALFSMIVGTIYGTFRSQLKIHLVQRNVAEMQQNVRAAMYLMERDIKMAGLNPQDTAGVGITTAEAHQFVFSMDYTGGAADGVDNDGDGLTDEGSNNSDDNGNGLIDEPDEAEWYDGDTDDTGEQITYRLSNDADNDGRNDGGTCHLLRNGDVIGLNIDALNFVYLDAAGNVLATPVSAADRQLIRSVQVTLVSRGGETVSALDRDHTDTTVYRNQQNAVVLPQQNDAFRRLALSTEIRCRNLGL